MTSHISTRCKHSTVYLTNPSAFTALTRSATIAVLSVLRNTNSLIIQATTGALIWGLTSHSAGRVSQQFEKRQVKKMYLAVVRGAADRFPQSTGTIEGPIRRLAGGSVSTKPSPPEFIRKEVVAKTQWELLATSVSKHIDDVSLLLDQAHFISPLRPSAWCAYARRQGSPIKYAYIWPRYWTVCFAHLCLCLI